MFRTIFVTSSVRLSEDVSGILPSFWWDGPDLEVTVTETGPLDLIGAIATAEAVTGRDNLIVKLTFMLDKP